MVSIFGFEWGLNTTSGADFLFASNVATGGRDILTGQHPLACIELDKNMSEWRAVAEFCRGWVDPNSVLFHGADDVWFEFDVADAISDVLAPSFFFGPRVGLDDHETALARTRAILYAGVEALREGPLRGDLAATLDQFLNILPPHARVFQAGLMLSRVGSPLRLCIDNLKPREIVELARELRGEADASNVTAAIERLGPSVLSIRPSFDIGDGVGQRIGLECYCAVPQRTSESSAWELLLKQLVADEMCSPSRSDMLLCLPSLIRAEDCRDGWPEDSSDVFEAWLGRERAVSIKLHHIKVTLESKRAATAKAYIALEKVWLG